MDPVGPWSTYAPFNRLAGVQASQASNELHHHLAANAGGATPTTTATPLLPGSFLTPPSVAYETVFTPLLHQAPGAKPTVHYVTQHKQVLGQAQAAAAAVAMSKSGDGEYPQTQTFFEQNASAWQQNGPFGILPHESVVATTAANFNAHFTAQSINHLNSLAAKNATIRAQTPQIVTTVSKTQPNATFFQVADSNAISGAKTYAIAVSQNIQPSCIVSSSNASNNTITKEYRVPQIPGRPVFAMTVPKQAPSPQTQTKAPPNITSQNERPRSSEGQQQNSPISFSLLDSRLNYANNVNNNKRPFQANYRHYQQANNNESDFQRSKEFSANSADCSVVVPRRSSPLQAHSQVSPIGHAPSPAYPLYNSPMNSAITSPQNSNNHVTPPRPLDVTVPRPNTQNNIAYPSVITRALNNAEKNFSDRYERPNQNCWDDRRKFNSTYNAGTNIEIVNRQVEVPRPEAAQVRQITPVSTNDRQQFYYDSNNHVTLQDLSSCRGDPMSIVKNLQQQQQSCQVQQNGSKPEVVSAVKRRKSAEKPPINDGRIPPPAHTSAANQPPQNGAYFDFDRWNLPAPPAKIFSTQTIQQHQGLMVPHPHTHHPSHIPYFSPFHLPPHPSEFSSGVELAPVPNYYEQNHITQTPEYHEQQEEQTKVVVPNIEEELNFLSKAPAVPKKPPPQNKPIIPQKPPDSKGPPGFMSSYLKFLQGERDSSPPPSGRTGRRQTWTRTKPENEVMNAERNGTLAAQAPVPVPLPIPPAARSSQGDPQDDPRYFPLPKERKTNKFSSDDALSSDEDLFNKIPPLTKDGKDKPARKGRPPKPGGPKERKKMKAARPLKEKKMKDKVVILDEVENVPRRESSKRAAKEKSSVFLKEDEEEPNDFADSDSDPVWTPMAADDEDDLPLKKGKKGRLGNNKKKVKNLIATSASSVNNNSNDLKVQKKSKSSQKAKNNSNEASNNHVTSVTEDQFKQGEFVILKADLNKPWPSIWRVDGKALLQKYEPFEQNEETLYRNISAYTSWTNETRKQYMIVPIKYRAQTQGETIVELLKHEIIFSDPDFIERVMRENASYQENFEVYIQTLISQALDSNFLTEIFQEQDDYFLSNVKIIDDISNSKKEKTLDNLRWPHYIQLAVCTWPCFNAMKETFTNNLHKCATCFSPHVSVRVLMYGQPYNATTLAGCQPDPIAAREKNIIMCRICASRVELLNKIAHQKYLMYIDCAKKVSEKRASDPLKDTTCILNELLADEEWLNQLFRKVRNHWAEADYLEHTLTQVKT